MINLDEQDVVAAASVAGSRREGGPDDVSGGCGDGRGAGVRQDRARDRGARTCRCGSRSWPTSGLSESGLDRVIRATYSLLGYISFFTVGEDECRAWSIPRGTIAQDAAGEIHTDIARGFIRAEVVAYDALIARGSMNACKEHGEVRLEGKEYLVKDGDIINFRHAT